MAIDFLANGWVVAYTICPARSLILLSLYSLNDVQRMHGQTNTGRSGAAQNDRKLPCISCGITFVEKQS